MIQEGQQLGEYEIAGRLGDGETGAVFKARQTSPERFVAIQSLDSSLASDAECVARFRREAEAAAALKHPNLVQVFGASESDGCHFVAMEFVPDESLLARIKRKGRIGPENAIALTVYMAGALEYAWKHAGLIHRGIKPAIVFVSREGNVRLGAFGLTRDPGAFRPPVLGVGTSGAPHYISPEQVEGKAGIDLRANIYSLGCVLYHMLSGRPPYEGGDAAEVMTQHVSAPPPDIRTVWPACPPTLAAVIRRTMQKAPAARYQSYDELTTALRHAYEVLGHVTVTAPLARPGASATVGSSRVDLQACKLEYSIVSPK